MNQLSDTDPARFYQDMPFPGRRLIAWAVGIVAIVIILPGWIFDLDTLPSWLAPIQDGVGVAVAPLYFLGFWRAVVGKGYPRILFLISLVPLIGLLILLFLPNRNFTASSSER